MKFFIVSHVLYCLSKRKFHSRNMEHHFIRIRKRTLKLAYSGTPYLSLDELLVKDKIKHPFKEKFGYLPLKFSKSKLELLLN